MAGAWAAGARVRVHIQPGALERPTFSHSAPAQAPAYDPSPIPFPHNDYNSRIIIHNPRPVPAATTHGNHVVASGAWSLATCTGSAARPSCKQLSFGKVSLQNIKPGRTPRRVQRCMNPGCTLKTKQHGSWAIEGSWNTKAEGGARVQQLRTTRVAVYFSAVAAARVCGCVGGWD
jgi:hypothetical protein